MYYKLPARECFSAYHSSGFIAPQSGPIFEVNFSNVFQALQFEYEILYNIYKTTMQNIAYYNIKLFR